LPAVGELAQQLNHLAHRQGQVGRVLEGQAAVGAVVLLRGDIVVARALLEPYLSLSDPLPPAATTFQGVRHLRVTYLAWMMQGLWEFGYAAQAQQRHAELLAQAQQLGHPPNLVYAQCFGALLAQYCRDAATTYARADAVTAFATAQGLEHNVVFGRILPGWALAMQGDVVAGVTHIRAGLEVVQRTGLKLYRPYFLAFLAEAYGQAGQPEAGLTALAAAPIKARGIMRSLPPFLAPGSGSTNSSPSTSPNITHGGL
jgi:predicted ATPase